MEEFNTDPLLGYKEGQLGDAKQGGLSNSGFDVELDLIIKEMEKNGESEDDIAEVVQLETSKQDNSTPIVTGDNDIEIQAEDPVVFDDLYFAALPQIDIKSKKSDKKFNPFGFLNFDNKVEFDKNSKQFLNQGEEEGAIQLRKILGDDFIVEESGMSIRDFFTKGASKNLDQVKIRHKDSDKEDFIKVDFNVGSQDASQTVIADMYKNSIDKLFNYVNQNMSIESLDKVQSNQRILLQKYNDLNSGPILNEQGELVKAAGPLHVSQEIKDKIKTDVKNISFEPTTSTSQGRQGNIVTTTTKPFEVELQSAKKQLETSGVENPTEKQIEDAARYNIEAVRVQDVYDQKATDYLNSGNVEDTDLDALLKLGGFISKKLTFEVKRNIGRNNLKLTKEIDDFEANQTDNTTAVGKANEFIKIASSAEAIQMDAPETEDRVTLQNGTIMTKAMYDDYMVAVSSYQKQYESIIKTQEELSLDIKTVEDDNVKWDLVRRNYHDGEKFISTLGHGFQNLIVNSAYGASKIQSGLFGIDNKNLDKDFLKVQEASNIYRNKFQKDIKFENAFSDGNFGKFLFQEIATQAPIFATLATGPVGIGVLGLSSSGENWARMVEEDKLYGTETSLLKKMFVSGGYGAAEILFDRYLTLPVMRRSGKALFSSAKNFRAAIKPSMSKYAKEFGKRQLIYDPALEVVAESGTTITQNILTGRPLTENLAHAAFSGGMFGTAFGHVPFYKGLVMSKFSDYRSYEGYRTNLNRVAGLQVAAKKLNTSLLANKTKGNDTSAIEGNIETVKQEIKNIQKENEGILKTVDKKVNNLSKKWFNIYNDITVQQEQIRIDAENIYKDESLSDTEKNELINIKQENFNELQQSRDILRDDKNFGNAYAGFRNSKNKKDRDRLQEIQGKAATELINEGKLEPNSDDIDTRTKIIYNKQEINKDYNDKKSMLGDDFKNFQTPKQAVDFVSKMNIDEASKKTIIENIEDGAHGVNITDLDGKVTPMQVVENMANADRIETRTHETGHFVFEKAFGNNKEAFDGIAESVLDFVEKRNPNLHLLLLNQIQRDKDGKLISEEVLTNFLELVAEGKIDLEATKNKGLGGFFGNILNMATKKSLGDKADFNFEGETDAISFLVKLGKKIKAGTLDIKKDIKDIQESGIASKVDSEKKITFSKDASDNVQRIYEDRGDAGAFDIIEAFKPITSKIVQRRSEAPNFDRELLTSEIEIGKRGILDLIREYNVNSGVPLAAYINKFLPARAIEASKRVLGEEFTTDITERVDVAAEEVTQQPTKPKKKKIVLADRLGVTDKVSKAINKIVPNLELDKLNFKTLKNKVPVITGDLFGISPKKIENLANLTKKELQSAQMFINKNADLLISMLPEGATASGTATGVSNTLLKAFYTKADRAKMAKTGSTAGLAVQQKNNINKTDFLETFGIIDGKPDRTDRNTSARVLALANLTGKMITNQAVRQKLGEADVKAKKAVDQLKDGKSKVMFSLESKLLSDFQLSMLSKKLGIDLTPLIYIQKAGKDKVYNSQRDIDAPFKINGKETGETYKEAAARGLNVFLQSNPEFRDLIQKTMTGGVLRAGFFQTVPEFNEVINGTIVEQRTYTKDPYNKNKLLDKNFVNKTKQKGYKAEQDGKLPLLLDFFVAVENHLKNNPSDIWIFEEMLKDTGKHQNTLTRILAPITAYPINKKGDPIYNKEVVEEHTNPQNQIGKALLAAAQIGNVQEMWKAVGKSYMQLSLLKSDDNLINDSGYQTSMPDIYYDKIVPRLLDGSLKLPDGLVSVVRLAESGIDLNNYYLINEKKTIAEFFNVDNIKDVKKANELVVKQLTGEITINDVNNVSKISYSKDIDNANTLNKATLFSRSVNPSKGITVLDFDDTLATTKSLVKFTTPDGKTGTLNAEQFASTYENLQNQGYTFDFSDFNKVVKGKLAPLFNKAIKLQGKFGPENMFVLTARPPRAQKAIFDFLKANGLNIPIKNITGLGNSTAEAKALWIADKVGDGYNDFYFADDALQNVQAVKNMLDQFDVKSKVQQAKIKFSKDASGKFNDIIQETTGIESQKVFSEAQAKIRGAKSKYKSIIPPSAQDFGGLLYSFLGKGKKGEQDMAFFKKALIDPFSRGINELNAARQASANDYENLLKQFPEVKKLLNKKIEGTDYTHDQAVRIYLWDQAGFEVPGLSKRDLKSVVDFVENNSKVKAFADTIGLMSKKEDGYSAPGDYWLAENIKSDLLSDGSIGDARAEFLAEWQQNADLIFSPENLNKIEAIYGSNFREALQDVLYRMKTGRNRPAGGGRLMNIYTNWVNNSVGAIMFLNMRSALLQTISATNYINWSDNNPLKAAAAFANQKQYWSDFSYLFNSDYLKQRRSGNQRGINEAELSAAVAGAENKAKAAIAWLLKKGFLPTQIADSFAISSGGATFYRNRIKAYIKQGMSKVDAEQKAFLDFQETTEVAQQSARPDMISQQQASPLGKLILAFQNTPMQYARIMNKATRDIYNGRGDMKTHTSKIIYYGFVQGIIFGALQSALFASLDDEDEEKFEKKKERILNGMIDSVLSGIGYGGKAISTMKNTLTTFLDQRKRGFNADHTYTILQLLGFSPPIGSKLRKVYSSIQTDKFNKDVFKRRGLTLDNPIWSAVGNVVEGVTNVPLGRFSQKMLNIDNALDANNKWWQRTALVLGWNTWDLGIKDADIEGIKKEIKKEKKIEAKEKTRIKREEKKKEKEEANKAVIEENKKKSKKDGLCSAVSKSGKRCKKKAINGGMCTVHEKAEQNESGKKTQCKHIKSSGKRCGMKTSSKSGLCYYHD